MYVHIKCKVDWNFPIPKFNGVLSRSGVELFYRISAFVVGVGGLNRSKKHQTTYARWK